MVEETEKPHLDEKHEHHLTPPASPTSGEAPDFIVSVKSLKGFVDSTEAKGHLVNGQPEVNYISANQSQEYFAVATNIGFEIVQNDSSQKKLKKKAQNLNESVEIIEMMYKSNIIVMVLSKKKRTVVIWDDHEKKNRTEITFNADIKNLRLRKDMLIVVLEDKIFMFNFETLKLMEQVETASNPMGICGISTAEKPVSKIVCFPHIDKGTVKVLNYVVDKSIESVVVAHESEVGSIAVNSQGTLIASSSIKGTVIRIFSTENGDLLQELRRGSNKAVITDIIFHPSLNLLACTSNRTSIHLFEIKKSIEKCIESKEYGFSSSDQKKHTDADNSKSKQFSYVYCQAFYFKGVQQVLRV